MPFKVVICGSRAWTDRITMSRRMKKLPENTIVITGGAPGADSIADELAEMYGFDRIIMPANWKKNGRGAGPMRNKRMLDMKPNLVIAFRNDGYSPGTDNTINEAKKRDIPVEVYGS